jgi:hypothetical protein
VPWVPHRDEGGRPRERQEIDARLLKAVVPNPERARVWALRSIAEFEWYDVEEAPVRRSCIDGQDLPRGLAHIRPSPLRTVGFL